MSLISFRVDADVPGNYRRLEFVLHDAVSIDVASQFLQGKKSALILYLLEEGPEGEGY